MYHASTLLFQNDTQCFGVQQVTTKKNIKGEGDEMVFLKMSIQIYNTGKFVEEVIVKYGQRL